MSYRRRHQQTSKPISTAIEKQQIGNLHNPAPPPDDDWNWDSSSSSVSLAAKAIRASSAHRDSSLSSAYVTGGGVGGGRGDSPSMNTSPKSTSFASRYSNSNPTTLSSPSSSAPAYTSKDSKSYEYTSMEKLNEPRRNESKNGLWGVLARKAKAFLDDDNESQQFDSPESTTMRTTASATRAKNFAPDQSHENHQKADSPSIQKKLSAFTSSINHIGGTIGSALEEGLSVVENRTAGIIEETRKHIKKNPGQSGQAQKWQSQMQTDIDLQLKASRDVAMAMAAKAKLLLRELKTVKADLAFAKERCAHLEEENKIFHENRERGDNPEDDDLIRLQLESLLAEKARLAHENSVYARENRFLREVVEYHQLTMQDVVYLDESTEEVTEVYPTKVIASNPLPSQDAKGVHPSVAE